MGILIYSLLEELPLIIFISPVLWVIVDLFTPNPRKHGKVIGWIFMEVIEHVIMPFILIFILILNPSLLEAVFSIILFIVYGFVFGNVKSIKDIIKLLWLVLCFDFIVFGFGSFVMTIQWNLGIDGWIVMMCTMLLILLPYLYIKYLQSVIKNRKVYKEVINLKE